MSEKLADTQAVEPGDTFEGDMTLARSAVELLRSHGHTSEAEAVRILLDELVDRKGFTDAFVREHKALATRFLNAKF
ncbi:hypothetical protein [Caulobacter soli]|uniref:hypothetical protein n=1 Tax=Caulobacter soli TaxID=2708539 RepID=UPI0013EA52F1|nr:hypothetical protein [Caulobacter soli]